MSTADPQPEVSATEELVAYLDGELSFDASRRVERRLATDEDYRRELSALDQAWSALEELPQAAVKDDFAHTTIEMVTVSAKRDLIEQTAALEAKRRRSTILAAAGCAAMAVAAFAAGRMLLPNENRALLSDLPVIAQLDVLSQIDNIDFLRGLSDLGIDDKLSDEDTAGQKSPVEEWSTPEARRVWVEQLSDERKADLGTKLKRFQSLVPAPASQDSLRKLQQEIAKDPNHAKLEKTLAAYTSWLAGRSPGERVDLRNPDLSTKDRLESIKQKLKRESSTATWQLSLDDEKALQDAVLDLVSERRQELMREIPGADDRNPQGQSTGMVAMWVILREMRDQDKREQIQDRLVARLSAPTQERFETLTKTQRVGQLRTWLRAAMQPKFGPLELERFFTEKLTTDQRERLLSMPQAEMEEQLERMYVGSQLGRPEREWAGAFGGPGFVRGGPQGPPPPPPRGAGRRGAFGPDNPPPPRGDDRRGPRDWDRGPRDRGPDGRGPEGPPDDRGPRGRRFEGRGPDGPPPGGPPEDWRDRPPRPEESGPPPPDEPR